jgi:hypothetical protein
MKSAFQKCIVNHALTRVPTPAMKLFFDDAEFDAQLQRTAAKTACRAADLGQILAVARRITPGDYGTWYAQWFAEGRTEVELARAETREATTTTPARRGCAPANISAAPISLPGAIPRAPPCWRPGAAARSGLRSVT